MTSYRIRFVNFWSSFDLKNNIFLDLVTAAGLDVKVVTDSKIEVDLEIVSVFPNRRKIIINKAINLVSGRYTPNSFIDLERNWHEKQRGRAKRRVWYTGENVRPPIGEHYNSFLSFDQRFFGENNLYFPLWMFDLGWFEKPRFNPRLGKWCHVTELTSGREIPAIPKDGFCAFVGNPDPVRLHVIEHLQAVLNSGLYGRHFGNPTKDKNSVASNFRFMLCFENDLYPGYVTEKIVEAYLSGTIPLYWGDFGCSGEIDFNENSFINLNDFSSMDEFIDKVKNYDQNWEEHFTSRLLNSVPDIRPIQKALIGS